MRSPPDQTMALFSLSHAVLVSEEKPGRSEVNVRVVSATSGTSGASGMNASSRQATSIRAAHPMSAYRFMTGRPLDFTKGIVGGVAAARVVLRVTDHKQGRFRLQGQDGG